MGGGKGSRNLARERVERAFDAFASGRHLSEPNEEETRCCLIDEILQALGWPCTALGRGTPSGAGDYLDYLLRAGGSPWLVVEAKRAGRTFHLEDSRPIHMETSPLSLKTLLSAKGKELRDALKQVSVYCNAWAVPYACATNGYQWVFFRGLSSNENRWTAGHALVFSSPRAVLDRFDDFASALGMDAAFTPFLPRILERPSSPEIPDSLLPSESLRFRHSQGGSERRHAVRGVAEALLADIHDQDRAEMLHRCYVSPGGEEEFEHRIRRLLKDSASELMSHGHDLVDMDPKGFADDLCERERKTKVSEPVLVVGHVGVGKTTFLHKALSGLRTSKSAFCVVVDLAGRGHGSQFDSAQEEAGVAQSILTKLGDNAVTVLKQAVSGSALLEADPDQERTLRTIFRKELESEHSRHSSYWSKNKDEWLRREYEVMTNMIENKVDFLVRYIKHIRARFKKKDGSRYPVLIVIDNIDRASDEYQKCIYGISERIALQTPAVLVVSLREDTFRRGWTNGGFLSSGQMNYVCHVAAPPLAKLLRKRASYAMRALEDGHLPKQTRQSSDVVRELCGYLQTAFLGEDLSGTELVASLAGHNTRAALSMVSEVAVSCSLEVPSNQRMDEFIFDSILPLLSADRPPPYLGLANCFTTSPSVPPCHALGVRLLAYFSMAFEQTDDRIHVEQTNRVLSRFAAWGYRTTLVEETLIDLLRNGLLRPSDGATWEDRELESRLPVRVSLTASGNVHLERLLSISAYRTAMACATRWYNREIGEHFVQKVTRFARQDEVTLADVRQSGALSFFEAYLAQCVEQENGLLASKLQQERWVGEVLARSARLLPGRLARSHSGTAPTVQAQPVRQRARTQQQRELFPLPPIPKLLPRVRSTLRYGRTVWIPRILWALEWARQSGLSPRTSSDLARILVDHGDIDVPPNNVARAFRDLKKDTNAAGLWNCDRKRYQITPAGSRLIEGLMAGDPQDDSGPT